MSGKAKADWNYTPRREGMPKRWDDDFGGLSELIYRIWLMAFRDAQPSGPTIVAAARMEFALPRGPRPVPAGPESRPRTPHTKGPQHLE